MSIAVLGGDEPLAEVVLRLIEEADVEVGQVHLLAEADSDASVSFRGEDVPVLGMADFDWRSVDLVVLASHGASVQRQAEMAAQAGRPVLGGEALAMAGQSAAMRFYSGAALAVGRIARILQRKAGLAAIHVSLNLPMSQFGLAGIEELSNQTRALFALESAEAEVLPPRIAFNLVPLAAESRQSAASRLERSVEASVRSLLDQENLPVLAFACWVPVFYGHSAVLHAVVETELELAGLRNLLSQADGVTVMDEPLAGGVPTPATDALDSEAVFVGRLRVDAKDSRRLSMWLVFDGLRLEAAQIVAGLENLIEKNQKSVLT